MIVVFKKVALAALLAFVSVSPVLPTVLSRMGTAIGSFLVMAGVDQSCSVGKFNRSGSRLFLSGLAVLVANGQSIDYRKMFFDKASVGGPQNFMTGMFLVSATSFLTSVFKTFGHCENWKKSKDRETLGRKLDFSGATALLSGVAAYTLLSKIGCHL